MGADPGHGPGELGDRVDQQLLAGALDQDRGAGSAIARLGGIAGALAGGFVSGLAGFGTALMALGIWLYILPPAMAVSALQTPMARARFRASG